MALDIDSNRGEVPILTKRVPINAQTQTRLPIQFQQISRPDFKSISHSISMLSQIAELLLAV